MITYTADMPATCLRQGRRCYRRYPPAYVNICRRHAADIASCPSPCCRLTGKTLPVCRRCFRTLFESAVIFCSVNARWRLIYADIPPSTLTSDYSIASPNSIVYQSDGRGQSSPDNLSKLMDTVKEYPSIYHNTHREYKDQRIKKNACQ